MRLLFEKGSNRDGFEALYTLANSNRTHLEVH